MEMRAIEAPVLRAKRAARNAAEIHPLLQLQQKLGNRAVQRLVSSPPRRWSGVARRQRDRGKEKRDRGVVVPIASTNASPRVQRWGELEHKIIGNRAQNPFPYRGTTPTDMTALRSTPRKDPKNPHGNTTADLLSGAKVLVLGKERGWFQVVVESGNARDRKGTVVAAQTMTGYVSHELVTKSTGVFDEELPLGGGLNLTYGDLVAFGGDHFKDFSQIGDEAKTPAGRARLEKLRDAIDSLPTKDVAFEDEKTVSKEYAERFRNLALENISHFSHGGTAIPTWQKIHTEAILAALEAGKRGESGGLAKAYAMNAFGDHFLTDAFSSGHVRVPREQIIQYYRKLMQDVFWQIINHVSARLGNRIFQLLERDYRRVRWFGDEADRQSARETVRTQIVDRINAAGGAAKVQEQIALYVAGAFSKILHDQDNAPPGLKVVSKKHPEGWTALGDSRLQVKDNAKNLEYVTEAVQASKQDLLNAFNIGIDVLRRHGKTPPQTAIDAAMADLTKKVGPPFVAVDFVPATAPGVKPLADWEWGKLDKDMQTKLVALIARYLDAKARNDLLQNFPEVEQVRGLDARPREAATDIMNEFLADPVPFLNTAIGRAAGP
jgi:hypothetical protein